MLSYRHSFHAGNFADVLKHIILIQILEYLKRKDKPFSYIDTHAGPGKYDLSSDYALKNREFDSGIAKLLKRSDLPECVAHYVSLVKRFNSPGKLIRYPGSPLIAKQLLRDKDHLYLFELHNTEIEILKTVADKDKRIKVFHADGLKNWLGLLPPTERRGLVLIDPSYEIKSDYQQVVETLAAMYKRFAIGTYALWYPVIDRSRNQKLEHAIQASGIKNVQLFELGINADSNAHGMTASGVIVINPPWTLAAEMKLVLPWLAGVLGDNGEGFYRILTLVSDD
ncbi:23S rRNA (adenine(2030)-N(6))-methyltransferase RlmJ [Methylobacter sp.]|uniref:23S rRNA (adenine(2030)-N(6))-methyltransferase RlmJ n=1 Tax=Methylobacter sp. TaxID=2051955 RepID=UPI00121C0620|nr:23S rRNA (adenine(2030)-N(6))-methyltransferase RlmJ [Methylobacter sp.]TAK62100.1 MAG: 23S rRNA (adenine(2030)-N(6))-methyltransferase RlmJ [Methylobacter sp.]